MIKIRIMIEIILIINRDLQVHMMNFYGKSLQYGCKYIHHSMPKMLTIWLDHASRATITSDPADIVKLRQDRLIKMTQIMGIYLRINNKRSIYDNN